MNNRRETSSTTDINNNNEVDQLLQAAQDEVLLKLSTDSHMSRVAPDYLDSDLDRRFQALKSRPSSKPQPKQQQPPLQKPKLPKSLDVNNVVVDDQLKAVLGDDHLSARFAALKATLPSSSSSSSTEAHVGPKITDAQDYGKEVFDHEDEVEKLIKWAIDAARLDPSPPSDDEDDHSDGDDDDKDDDDDDDDDDDRVVHRKKDNRKN